MNPNPTHKLSKKEEIRLRAVQILIDSLTGDGFDKIRKIVCSNGSNDNESNRFEKSTKIFHIIFSPDSIQALIKNMKLTGVAKSGIEIFKATNRLSSLFSSKKTTTTRRKTTTNASSSRSRTSDLVISQVDTYLKADSVLIIERAFDSLVKSCNTPDVFSSVVRSQCVEPIIKHIMNKGGENVVNYFDGGGGGSKKTTRLFKKASRRRRHNRTRTRIRH